MFQIKGFNIPIHHALFLSPQPVKATNKQHALWRVEKIGDMARWALETEVLLSPKPGLVDQLNTGSHQDLTVDLMLRSARALMPLFTQMAQAGQEHVEADLTLLRERIGHLGRVAEEAMMIETQGVNTHRGAIWALGLLATAAGQLSAQQPDNLTAQSLCEQAGVLARLPDQYAPIVFSKGLHATRRYKINGAREEAQNGFLSITECALPELRGSRHRGDSEEAAQLNALLALMTRLDDTCVLSRSGIEGLELMQSGAKEILATDGSASLQGMAKLIELNKKMVAINASPGGAADLLAATLFVDALETQLSSHHEYD
ncbi:triphosphoribosyl-dephospho-CoA synthase [Vibrio jasicida]|uniref:Probable 2-(5''-triphosphoribosyl)-3'-dephosphocoenzyme-A synthase n=1 Tax=Vibrio jasicida TaxID=766224 RepID=A0ABW7JHB9_9VIBR